MGAAHLVSSSADFAVAPEVAYDALVAAPLEELFTQRSGPIPPVARCEDPRGTWGEPGASRRVVLADGSTNLETLVGADRDDLDYRYQLTEFTGPFRFLVGAVDGRFDFEPVGESTRVTWSWALHPANPVGALLLPLIGRFWQRWAARMWPRFGDRVS